jgi:hypothetical protein
MQLRQSSATQLTMVVHKKTLFLIMPHIEKSHGVSSHDQGGAVNCTTPSDPLRKAIIKEFSNS